MTTKLLCDGCIVNAECPHRDERVEEFGYHQKAHYCPAAAEKYQAFLAARDALHDKVAKQWQEGLTKLKRQAEKDGLHTLASG